MRYVEMTVEQALKICNKNDKVLVAVHDLENDDDCNIIFVKKKKDEYDMLFNDVKTVASACDDFVKQLKCFTEKQNIYNIKPNGFEKIILLEQQVRFIGLLNRFQTIPIDKTEQVFYTYFCQ